MPAPVVYIAFAVVGVGALLAFKELVYEPHIAPFIIEVQASRRRRQEEEEEQRRLVPPVYAYSSAPSHLNRNNRSSRRHSGTDSDPDSDSERYGRPYAEFEDRQAFRHPKPNDQQRPRPLNQQSQSGIELEELVARELREWRSPPAFASTDGLRLRRNATGAPLDESNHDIPFAPLTPNRSAARPAHSSPSATVPSFSALTPAARPTSFLPTPTSPLGPSANNAPFGRGDARRQQNIEPGSSRSSPVPAARAISTPTTLPSSRPAGLSGPGISPKLEMSTLSIGPSDSLLFSTGGPFHRSQTSPTPTSGSAQRMSASGSDYTTDDETVLSSLATSPPLPPLPAVPPQQQSRYTPEQLAKLLPSPPTAIPIARTTPSSSHQDEFNTGAVSSSVASTRTITLQNLNRSRNQTSPQQPITTSSSDVSLSSPTPSSTATHSPSQSIPSLSQIYPQDLEYERNVILLSPPSSRSESPFSVIGTSNVNSGNVSRTNSPSLGAAGNTGEQGQRTISSSLGSPFVGFGALGLAAGSPGPEGGQGQGQSLPVPSINTIQRSTPTSPNQGHSTDLSSSRYLSFPSSPALSSSSSHLGRNVNLTTAPSTLAESIYYDASYAHVSPSVLSRNLQGANPFADPPQQTPTTPRMTNQSPRSPVFSDSGADADLDGDLEVMSNWSDSDMMDDDLDAGAESDSGSHVSGISSSSSLSNWASVDGRVSAQGR
ncbi:hypothetical protein FA15DRAFT_669285 [Coprinopsis marcescibilis]|uniref:Uncharacterized protein n=1 Tax=Coprinopsis marcescibilis TaxID=230819 RepID=A0A5C3KXY4_COPMA|nr:hypothetical protein FA15DRAFT_669285 [Coprinopsis marcescibilis]